MSDYSQVNDYSAKDALATGNANKLIKGSDIDAELSAISTAVASKTGDSENNSVSGSWDFTTEPTINSATVCKIKTGTFSGDGATSQAVTGIGFQVLYVKIWQRQTTDTGNVTTYESTDTIVDDNAAGMAVLHAAAGGHTGAANAIIALGSDGFTVDDGGTDAHPNKNGQTYNYLALG